VYKREATLKKKERKKKGGGKLGVNSTQGKAKTKREVQNYNERGIEGHEAVKKSEEQDRKIRQKKEESKRLRGKNG